MQITLPLPPSDNALHRAGKTKTGKPIVYPTQEYKAWVDVARSWLRAQATEVAEGDVAVHLAIYFPTRAGDLTNRVKAAHDILQGVAFTNDSQVVHAAQRREVDGGHPRIIATIKPLTVDLFTAAERRSGDDRRRGFIFDVGF